MAKNWIVLYGRNSIYERLKTDPSSIRKIFLKESSKIPRIEDLAKARNVPVERIPAEKLESMRPARDIQGILARVDKFKYKDFNEFFNFPQGKELTLIFLDRISDPHNLGVIIRTAACFGGFGIVIATHGACDVNETVLHVASGGENYVPISLAKSIKGAITEAKRHGYKIMGTVVTDDSKDLNKISLSFPLAIVLGSEGKGIIPEIKRDLDIKARIPMHGAKLSFNVNMACGILCYETAKQRSIFHEKETQ